MNKGGRRTLGLVAIALGVAAAAGGWASGRAARPDSSALDEAAKTAAARNQQALEAATRRLEPAASQAARIPELVAALDPGFDAHTFQDGFESEDWWADARKSFALSLVVVGDAVLGSVGPEKLDPSGLPLIEKARTSGLGSGVIVGPAHTYLAGAALVNRGDRDGADRKPVLVLAQLLDDKALAAMAGRTGDGLGLSDGKQLVESAGPPELQHLVPALAGHEAAGLTAAGPNAFGLPLPLAPRRWLWIVFAGPPAPPAPPVAFALEALGALLALGGLVLLVLGGGPAQALSATDPRIHDLPTQREIGLPRTQAPPASAPPDRDDPAPPRHAAMLPTSETKSLGSGGPALAAAALPRRTPPYEMGRYRLMKLIGEGGMAEVYTAAAHGAEGFRRQFVVKRLHPHLAGRKDVVSQFIDEARLQARLLHSNIVPVFDFGRAGDEYYLALEYVHGRDFEKVVRRHIERKGGPLPASIVFYVIAEVLEALAYAHDRTAQSGEPLGIVHRDVSPGNVLISYLGEVKLSDFGIVKADGRVSHTDVGVVKGNVSFMSPEQARGEQVDLRSDLFSAGMVLYYGLTGRALYSGETTFNQLMRAAVGPVTEQFRQIEDLPADARAVLSKALAQEPAARFQRAGDFVAAIAERAPAGKSELSRLMQELFAGEMDSDF